MRASETAYRNHKDLYALTAFEQADAEIQYARLDVEIARLEASQPAAATEQGGSNFIEALNANAADFFPQHTETGKEGKDEHVNKDDG
jgi:hypothetical protein